MKSAKFVHFSRREKEKLEALFVFENKSAVICQIIEAGKFENHISKFEEMVEIKLFFHNKSLKSVAQLILTILEMEKYTISVYLPSLHCFAYLPNFNSRNVRFFFRKDETQTNQNRGNVQIFQLRIVCKCVSRS